MPVGVVRKAGLLFGVLLLAVLAAGLLVPAKPAWAATFTVTSTADTGGPCGSNCTLRQAIQSANSTTGTDTINFAIPGAGVRTINLTSALPGITRPVTIDGYTQGGPGYSGSPLIELDGAGAGDTANGLSIRTSNSVVQGLVINRFKLNGIIISGPNADGNLVRGNYIGTDATGTQNRGNAQNGVFLNAATNNTVGGTAAAAPNIIAFNGLDGVRITGASTNNAILPNSIFDNGGLGIDLFPVDGVTPNDDRDPDTGPNTLQNYPVLNSASRSGGVTTITGTLNSTPNTTFAVQFFSSPEPDQSGFGEGRSYLGQGSVTTDGNGNTPPFAFATPNVATGQFVTATATNPTNNTSEFSEAVKVPPADLTIEKTDGPPNDVDPPNETVTFGDDITYTITVRNATGAGEATGVQVTDALPSNTTFVSASSTQGSCPAPPDPGDSSGTVTCNLGTISAGASATVTIKVRPTEQAVTAGSVTNTARVTSPDDPGTPRQDTETTAVNAANLTITKDDGTRTGRVRAGENFTYTVEAGNTGADARDVTITDRLPAAVTFVSATDDCQYNENDPARTDDDTVVCGPFGLSSGAQTTRRITVTAPAEEATFTNVATVRSPNDPANGRDAERTTTADAFSDLSIEKVSDPATVTDEDEFVYHLTVHNAGPSTAEDVTVTDELPAGVLFVSASQGCSHDSDADTVTCVRNRLPSAVGQNQAVFNIRVKAKTPGKKVNRATVTSPTENRERSGMSNDSDTATTIVRPKPAPSADLSLRTSAPGTVTEDKNFAYTLTVRNKGPDVATSVVVEDRLPLGVSFVSASGGCENQEDTVTCSVGELNDGATVTKKIVVRADEDGRLRNSATVSSKVEDPILRNNSDTETTRARPERDGRCTRDQPVTSNIGVQDGCGREPQASTSNQLVRDGR